MSYPMYEIYKFLKKKKGYKIEVERENDKIISIYCNPKGKILLENFGDHIPCVTISFELEKFKVIWGVVTVESDYSGEGEFEDYTKVIKDLEENL